MDPAIVLSVFILSFNLVIVCGLVEWIKYTTPIWNIV